jgi:hypothetical protein
MIIRFHHYHHKQLLILSQDIRYQIIYDRSDAIKDEQTHAHNVRLHRDVTLVVEDHSSASLVDFLSISILKTISQTNDGAAMTTIKKRMVATIKTKTKKTNRQYVSIFAKF